MGDRILRPKVMADKMGWSMTSLWRYSREGIIDPPIRIGPNSVGWRESYADQLIAARAATPYQPSGRGKIAHAARMKKKAAAA